jgi:uncharacterized membrane protein YqhA
MLVPRLIFPSAWLGVSLIAALIFCCDLYLLWAYRYLQQQVQELNEQERGLLCIVLRNIMYAILWIMLLVIPEYI